MKCTWAGCSGCSACNAVTHASYTDCSDSGDLWAQHVTSSFPIFHPLDVNFAAIFGKEELANLETNVVANAEYTFLAHVSSNCSTDILSGFSKEKGWLLFDTPANADNLCVKTEDEWKAFQVILGSRETCADKGAILTIHNLRLFPASCGFESCTLCPDWCDQENLPLTCTWDTCKTCSSCEGISLCASWCMKKNSVKWATKRMWENCAGCEQSSMEGECVGEVPSSDTPCAAIGVAGDCEAEGVSSFSDGICDWVAESGTTSDAVGVDSYDIDGYENLGSGYCVDESGNRLDVYYQSGISEMNPTECASLCDQQPLCKGLSLKAADETVCEHWIPNGQGPIESGYANFEWYEYENAGTSIQGAEGDTAIGSISCYKKESGTTTDVATTAAGEQ